MFNCSKLNNQPLNQPTDRATNIDTLLFDAKPTKRDKKYHHSSESPKPRSTAPSTSINFKPKQTVRSFVPSSFPSQIYNAPTANYAILHVLPLLSKFKNLSKNPAAERRGEERAISRTANLRITPRPLLDKSNRGPGGDTRVKRRVDGLSVTVEHLITSVKRSRLNSGYELTNPLSETHTHTRPLSVTVSIPTPYHLRAIPP